MEKQHSKIVYFVQGEDSVPLLVYVSSLLLFTVNMWKARALTLQLCQRFL